jgi:hypothetical protein
VSTPRRLLVLAVLAAVGCGGEPTPPSGKMDLKVPPTPPVSKDDPGGKRNIIGPPPPVK